MLRSGNDASQVNGSRGVIVGWKEVHVSMQLCSLANGAANGGYCGDLAFSLVKNTALLVCPTATRLSISGKKGFLARSIGLLC